MFLRKLLGSNEAKAEEKKAATPPGMQAMGATLQRKFAKGVQYNSEYFLFVISPALASRTLTHRVPYGALYLLTFTFKSAIWFSEGQWQGSHTLA